MVAEGKEETSRLTLYRYPLLLAWRANSADPREKNRQCAHRLLIKSTADAELPAFYVEAPEKAVRLTEMAFLQMCSIASAISISDTVKL